MLFKSLCLFIALLVFTGLCSGVNETFIYLVFAYAGIATHYLKKWSEKVEKGEEYNLKKSVPSIILTFITTTVLVLIRAEIVNLFVFTKGSAFIVGYCGHSWFFGLIDKKIYSINPNIKPDEEN